MEMGQRPRSELLAKILMQMQQSQQYQPQSYGALAAGLGTAFLDKRNYDKESKRIAQQEHEQKGALVRELSKQPQNMALGDVGGGPDIQMQQTRMENTSLLDALQPEQLQGIAGALAQKQLAPEQAESPFAKLDPAKFTPESVAQFQTQGGSDFSLLKTRPDSANETWKPATKDERKAYGVPDKYGAQISSTGKMATIGADGQVIGIHNYPAVPIGAQENITGAFGMKRALNEMKETYEFSSVPGVGAVRGALSGYTGNMDPQALRYQTAYDNFRTQQQAIIKGIPSNFDVKIFEKAAPSPGLSPEAKMARINFQEKLTDDLIRMSIAFYKSSRSPIPQQIADEAKALGINISSIAPNAKAAGYDEILEMDGKKLVRLSDGSWMPIPEDVE